MARQSVTPVWDPDLAGWRRLACAILVQAHRDALSTNGAKAARAADIPPALGLAGDARQFLASDAARWLVGALDLDPTRLDLLVATLPAPFCEQPALPGFEN